MRSDPGTTSTALRLGCLVGLVGLLGGCTGTDDLSSVVSHQAGPASTGSVSLAAATDEVSAQDWTASATPTASASHTARPRGRRRGDTPPGTSPTGTADPAVRLPPVHVPFDYQLGGAYTPPSGTRVVVRDRAAAPLRGAYSVCYVNAYQAQPGELAWWKKEHPSLLLRDGDGDVVIDQDWDEALLDISTDSHRKAIRDIVGSWFASCAAKGFDAVEPDNLDSWTRSDGRLHAADAMAMARLLVAEAHGHGLAIAQKNTVEHSTELRSMGYDFATAEECTRYAECDGYARAYANRVLVVEYTRQDLSTACRNPAIGGTLSVVLRDMDLTTPSAPDYVRATC